jgi:two-component system, cell cycle sensor histidine kinase and response regulator CckA
MVIDKNTDQNNLIIGEGLVMVVDDESIMRKIAANVLEGCGYNVITVNGGIEAVKIFTQRHKEIDMVLLDLLMPDKCGKETYYDMQKIQSDVKVLLVTGANKDGRIQELLDNGVKGLVEKPYTFSLLSQTVHEILSQENC